jgi:glutathione synthase/RimK-type ligase-like ATP-grasp enzyme
MDKKPRPKSHENKDKVKKRGKSSDPGEEKLRVKVDNKNGQDNISTLSNHSDSSEFIRNKIILGVCAMEKKTKSEAMRNLLKLINTDSRIDLLIFSEKTILKKPIREWRKVHALICFFSKGFPLSKAEKYAEMNNVYLINNIKNQRLLWDRTKIYSLLKDYGIPVADHRFVQRFKENPHEDPEKSVKEKKKSINVEEFDNHIIIGDQKINKPFVEKPFDAENHNIRIYYPMKEGGGCKFLFRKINNISSRFNKTENKIRRDGNYIYEEFLPNDGFDIKVYAIGLDYFHAETRKSPTVDGIVMRTKNGKEVRYPVNLTLSEKIICRKIVMIFDQTVCGFDIIRSKGKSYVCDVNGWSFVKGNKKYTKDCAFLLRKFIYQRFFPDELENLLKGSSSSKLKTEFHNFRPFIKKIPISKDFVSNRSNNLWALSNREKSVDNLKSCEDLDEYEVKPNIKADTQSKNDVINELKDFDTKKLGKKQKPAPPKRHKDSLSMCLTDSPKRFLSPIKNSKNHSKRSEVTSPNGASSNSLLFSQPNENSIPNKNEELRSVIAIFRHQDRSPKQKMKMKTSEPRFLSYFKNNKIKEIKLKTGKQLEKVFKISKEILKEINEKMMKDQNNNGTCFFSIQFLNLQLFNLINNNLKNCACIK